MDINMHAVVALHQLHRVADVGDASLAQHIDLHKPQLLGGIHVVLRRRKTLGWQVEGGIVGDRLLGNQHATGMDRPLIREVTDALR